MKLFTKGILEGAQSDGLPQEFAQCVADEVVSSISTSRLRQLMASSSSGAIRRLGREAGILCAATQKQLPPGPIS